MKKEYTREEAIRLIETILQKLSEKAEEAREEFYKIFESDDENKPQIMKEMKAALDMILETLVINDSVKGISVIQDKIMTINASLQGKIGKYACIQQNLRLRSSEAARLLKAYRRYLDGREQGRRPWTEEQ